MKKLVSKRIFLKLEASPFQRKKPTILRNALIALIFLVGMLSFNLAKAQTPSITVTGKVTDNKKEPLPGVSVRVKGTSTAVMTNQDGTYRITVPAQSAVLTFGMIGSKTTERTVGTNRSIDVTLEEESSILDDVVVIGYGTRKRNELTEAVSSLKGEDLVANNPISINQGLQGMIAGVEVNRNDGAPGAGISLTIRGANSFTGSEPLYVVDDIPITSAGQTSNGSTDPNEQYQTLNPISFLNPQDIESIEILKDASATAIYGSRGSNGVVLITTKKGKVGKDKIDFTANIGLAQLSNKVELLGAYEYALRSNEARRNFHLYEDAPLSVPFPGAVVVDPILNITRYIPKPEDFLTGIPAGSSYPEGFTGTDWLETILRTAVSNDYSLRISGGNDKGTYAISGNMVDQQGIILNSGYKRYGTQININRKVSKLFEMGMNTNVSFGQYRMVKTNTSQSQSSLINSAMLYPSIYAFTDPFSELRDELLNNTRVSNPYKAATNSKDVTRAIRVVLSGFGQVNISPNLNYRQRFGYNLNSNPRETYLGRTVHEGRPPINGRASEGDVTSRQFTTEGVLSYRKTFDKKHTINAMGAASYETANEKMYEIKATGFPTDLTENYNFRSGLIQLPTINGKTEGHLLSFLGRVNYNYAGKYILTANFRRDGSSRFTEKNQFANFGSVSAAWNVSAEEFFKKQKIFSNFKIRGSYGTTGNQAIVPYATRYQMMAATVAIADLPQSGYALPQVLADLNQRWETTYQADLGVDMGFLKNKLTVTVDLYHKRTEDLLQTTNLEPSQGFPSGYRTNFGAVVNRGLEISVYGDLINNKNFGWKVNGNLTFNRNKVQGLEKDQFRRLYTGLESPIIIRNGSPIGSIYGMVEDGFYDSEAEVRADPRWRNLPDAQLKSKLGEIKYKDLNGDGQISEASDRTIIGNTQPDYTFGITNTFTYKKFTLTAFVHGAVGNDILNTNAINIRMGERTSMPKFAYDGRWTPETTATATWPRLDAGQSREMFFSDRFVEDGSFIRFKTLSFGYTFNLKGKIASTINVYGAVNNLMTLTNYSWFDPDVNSFGADASRKGVDMNSYPNTRTYSLGLRLGL